MSCHCYTAVGDSDTPVRHGMLSQGLVNVNKRDTSHHSNRYAGLLRRQVTTYQQSGGYHNHKTLQLLHFALVIYKDTLRKLNILLCSSS